MSTSGYGELRGIVSSQDSGHFLVVASDEEQCSLRPTFANADRTRRSSDEKTWTNTRPRSLDERMAPGLADK